MSKQIKVPEQMECNVRISGAAIYKGKSKAHNIIAMLYLYCPGTQNSEGDILFSEL